VSPRLCPSPLLAIYSVLSETIQFEKTAIITSNRIAAEKFTKLDADLSSISSGKPEENLFILKRLAEKE
jgi:hypothetical protein